MRTIYKFNDGHKEYSVIIHNIGLLWQSDLSVLICIGQMMIGVLGHF